LQQIESGRTVLNFREIPNLNLNDVVCIKKIRKKKKERDHTTRRLVTIHYLPIFSRKSGPVTSFAGAFNALNFHQICQNLHETNHQTSLYVGVWSSPAHWQINGRGTTLKRPSQAACSCRFDNLTVHHV